MSVPDAAAMRRCVFAVSVLQDVDLTPTDDGVLVGDRVPVVVPWQAVGAAMRTTRARAEQAVTEDELAVSSRRRVEVLLRLHRLIGQFGPDAAHRFHSAGRLVALPPGHADHPGRGWPRELLRGDALELGIGVHGLLEGTDAVVPLPPSVLDRLGVPARSWWPEDRDHADRMGALASSRLRRDGQTAVIRPVGGVDVLALLTSRTLRRHLAAADGSGLATVAAPTRRRGWSDLRHSDPAFVAAAWTMTTPARRGSRLPLLVTADEVQHPLGNRFPRADASEGLAG